MKLLSKLYGDAVLLFNGEELVLQRIGRQLSINKEWGVWHQESLALDYSSLCICKSAITVCLRNVAAPDLAADVDRGTRSLRRMIIMYRQKHL